MNRLLQFVVFLLLASPVHATFTATQKANNTTTGTSVVVTLPGAAGAGTLIVVHSFTTTLTVDLTSVTATGESFTVDAACRVNNTASGVRASGCAYTLSAAGGQTAFTCNFSASATVFCDVRAYSFTVGPVSKDAVLAEDRNTSQIPQLGVALTLSGTNDVIVQGFGGSQSATAISSPYGNLENVNAAYADSLNTASGTAPTWTLSTGGTGVVAGIAFKEATGAAPAPPRRPAIVTQARPMKLMLERKEGR